MNTDNLITEQQIATAQQISSGPYTVDQLWAIVYERFGGDLQAVHAHLNKAQTWAQALREAGYEAKRDHLTNTANEYYDQADDLEARITQTRRYLRALASAEALQRSYQGYNSSPDNVIYQNQNGNNATAIESAT